MRNPTNEHLKIIKTLWSLQDSFLFHRKVENFIYFGRRQSGEEVVLRLTEPGRRSAEQLKSELDWQHFLIARGVSVAAPLISTQGNFVETLDVAGSDFHVSVFEKAQGIVLFKPEQLTEDVMWKWGETIAEFHEATKLYRPSQGLAFRPQWTAHISEPLVAAIEHDPRSREAQRFQEINDLLKSLPKDQHSYGLVHTDLHNGNFLWANGHLTAFDLDDCCYHWFCYDLAVPLFYLRFRNAEEQGRMDLEAAQKSYLEAYRSKMKTLNTQLDLFESFISYRKLIMYGWCQNQLRLKVLDQAGLNWCTRYLEWVRTEKL